MARQPIFDRDDGVYGYELLFRGARDEKTAVFKDGDAATSSVITDGYSMARSALGADKKIFINFTQRLLLEEAPFALPPENCLVEILETVRPDDTLIQSCRQLKDNGYTLVLDDYKGQVGFERLFPLLDIVKVDINSVSPQDIAKFTRQIKDFEIKLLAEKIETIQMYHACKRYGFDYYQGYFFCRPQVLPGRKLSASRVSRFRLLKEISRPGAEISTLADIIQADAALSYRMLRFVNSVFFGLRHKVGSIQSAIALVGLRQLTQWARLTLLSDMNDAFYAHELVFLAAQRGKFLQDLAVSTPNPPLEQDTMFLFGLFSLLPALLEQDMPAILSQLPLEDDLTQALMGRDPETRKWFRLALALERGDWRDAESMLELLALDKGTAAKLHGASLAWAEAFLHPKASVA